MPEECKLFIGALLPECQKHDLTYWMSYLADMEPDEIYMMEVKEGKDVRCAFAIYRRASE